MITHRLARACGPLRGSLAAFLTCAMLFACGPVLAAPALWLTSLSPETNPAPSGQLGYSLSPAGDVNGDGYGDLVAGLPFFENSTSGGRMSVYFGGPDGIASVIHRSPSQPGAQFGYSVAGAGDVNGDGFDDVLCGAPAWDNPEVNEGGVFLYMGRADGNLDGPVIFEMNDAGARYGHTVAWAGDVNGDGYAEILAGAPYWGGFGSPFYIPVQGAVRMYYGAAGTPTTYWSRSGGQEDMEYGWGVAGVGDVNGDGYNDVAVGAPKYQAGLIAANHGTARCYLGGPGGLASSPVWTVTGSGTDDRVGERVSRAGDVNGDGYADLLLASPLRTVTHVEEGGFALYHGGPSGPAATPAYAENGGDASDRLGWALATSGDLNGDGYADFMTRRTEPPGHNIVRTFLGGPAGITETLTISNSNINQMGFSLAATDLDGDGRNEIHIGGPDYGANSGVIYRVYARHANPTPNYAAAPHWSRWGTNLDDGFGQAVAAGDLNGDGYDELVIGVPGDDGAAGNGGRVDVYLGSANGLPAAGPPDWSYASPTASGRFGFSLDIAGDVDGDGYADLIVGEPNSNRIHIFNGGPSGLAAAPDWTYTYPPAGAWLFGQSVAGAGDVNGDGFADVIAGAPLHTAAFVNEGRARILFGSAGGLMTTGFLDLATTPEFNALFGGAVDGAGDVNADGFDDVIVGAQGGSNGDGMAFVYLGSADGPVGPPVWTEVGGGNGGAAFGTCVAGIGDVDADGYCDVAVGAPNYTTGGPVFGRTRVFRGGASGIAGMWYQKVGPQSSGEAVAGAGDYDQDGQSDVLLSAPTYSIGGVILVVRDALGFGNDIWQSGAVEATGYSLAAGDFNGDRIPEFVAGARQDAASVGRVVVYRANADGYAHGPYRSRQLTGAGDPVAEAGLSPDVGQLRLAVKGWTAAGRTKLRMEHQLAEMGDPFGAIDAGAWMDSGSQPLDLEQTAAVTSGTAYRWRARLRSADPAFLHSQWLCEPVRVATMKQLRTADDVSAAPDPADGPIASVVLESVHPNPARGSCRVSFSIDRDTDVALDVVDVTGRRVTRLMDGPVTAGRRGVTWDGRDAAGSEVADGVYFFRLRAAGTVDSRKVLIRR